MSNDWYEKGEVPPNDTWCQMFWPDGNGWRKCKFIGVNTVTETKVYAVVFIPDEPDLSDYHNFKINGGDLQFKPLKSKQDQERDEFVGEIEKAMGCVEPINIITVRETAAIIFNKGYRKVKPLTFYDLETCLTRACLQLEPAETQVLLDELLENNHIASEGE